MVFCEPKTSAILVTAVVLASNVSFLSDDFSKLHAVCLYTVNTVNTEDT